MNKLTLAALLGFASAEDFIGNDKCAIADANRIPKHEFYRQMAQGLWKNIVKGAYHSKTDLISDECLGDWMGPMMHNVHHTFKKAHQDPMSITIDEAYEAATGIVDIHFRNRDSCQYVKVFDDYKNWCANNLEMCVGTDNGQLERIYDHGYDLFGAFYDLAGIYFFEEDACSTDAEFIQTTNKIVADTANILSVVIGFEADYNVKSEHITNKELKNDIADYFEDLYQSAKQSYFDNYMVNDTMTIDMYIPTFNGVPIDELEQPEMPSFGFPFPFFSQPSGFDTNELPPMPEMPTYDLPPMPEFPEFPDFPKFSFW